MDIIINILSGVVGSAIFAVIVFYGRKIVEYIKNLNFENYTYDLKEMLRCLFIREIRNNLIIKRACVFLKTLSITLTIFILLTIYSDIRKTPSIIFKVQNAEVNKIVDSLLSFISFTALSFLLGYLCGVAENIYQLIISNPKKVRKEISIYLKRFSKKISENDKEFLNKLLLLPDAYLKSTYYDNSKEYFQELKYNNVDEEKIDNIAMEFIKFYNSNLNL